MRRLLLLTVATGIALGNSGCFLNEYSSDPNRRMHQLINESENLRQLENELEHFWMLDHPSHLTDERVDGGMQP